MLRPLHLLLIFLTLTGIPSHLNAQRQPLKTGVELDLLPYALNGYFGAAWAGKGAFRGRVLYANVKIPSLVVPDEFTNNRIRSVALLLDYFPKKELSGWWLGGGPVLWKGSIQPRDRSSTSHYNSFLANGSAGYLHYLGRHLYLSPWAGMSLRMGGDRNILVGEQTYTPPFFNPELSLKFGWQF